MAHRQPTSSLGSTSWVIFRSAFRFRWAMASSMSMSLGDSFGAAEVCSPRPEKSRGGPTKRAIREGTRRRGEPMRVSKGSRRGGKVRPIPSPRQPVSSIRGHCFVYGEHARTRRSTSRHPPQRTIFLADPTKHEKRAGPSAERGQESGEGIQNSEQRATLREFLGSLACLHPRGGIGLCKSCGSRDTSGLTSLSVPLTPSNRFALSSLSSESFSSCVRSFTCWRRV